MTALAIAVYAAAIVAANLIAWKFGPAITPVNAFVLIGLDLALRNWLNLRLSGWAMGALILTTGGFTLLVNPGAQHIAVASAVAFTFAALADWSTFRALRNQPWMQRCVGGSVAGAAVDSLIFPTLAFGGLMPLIALMQFVAKVAGGALWAYVLRPRK